MKWLPLPKIAHGIAVYPFSPASLQPSPEQHYSSGNSRRHTTSSTIQSPLFSPQPDTASILASTLPSSAVSPDPSSSNPADYACLIDLEVGDELFILEQYAQWYRGYVLSSLEGGKKPNIAPIGCFPKTHVQIKEYLELDQAENGHVYNMEMAPHRTDVPTDTMLTPTGSWATTTNHPGLPLSLSESPLDLPTKKPDRSLPSPPHELPAPRQTSQVDTGFHVNDDPSPDKPRHAPAPSLLLARFDQSTITGSSEPLVDEIGAAVSEWNCLLYKYLDERRYAMFNAVRDHTNFLFQARRQLLDQALSKEEMSRLRRDIINRMVLLNIAQDRDMIIRHPERGYILDAQSVSLATLLQLHWKYSLCERISLTTPPAVTGRPSIQTQASAATIDTSTSQAPSGSASIPHATHANPVPQRGKFYHLFFEQKACVAQICQPGEFTELSFSLYNNADGCFITEQFTVVLTYNGMPKDEQQIGQLHTLFTDLGSHDVTDHLYLVCRIVRLGNIKYADKEKEHFGSIGGHTSMFFGNNGENRMKNYFDSSHSRRQQNQLQTSPSATSLSGTNLYRRPFGCAVLHVGTLIGKPEQSPVSGLVSPSTALPTNITGQHRLIQGEHDLQIYAAVSESMFSTLHQEIINNNIKDLAKSARGDTLCVYLRLFHGQLDSVLKTNAALLQDVPRTLRLGFPDAVFPDDKRNELYVTLNAGDFTQFSKARNIQVNICVRDNFSGDVVENAISAGTGSPSVSSWDSVVFYHEQRPKWEETIRVAMPDIRQWDRAHLFFTIRHRSSHGTGGQNDFSLTSSSGSSASGSDRVIAIGYLPLFLPPLHRYFVADGTHTLCLFKYDRQLPHPRVYLDTMPWCVRSSSPFNLQIQEYAQKLYQNNGGAPHLKSSPSNGSTHTFDNVSLRSESSRLTQVRDTVTIKTFLCSTHFTQNETLVLLHNWKAVLDAESEGGGFDELLAILVKFPFVGEMEVVKFLNDVFDALFDILIYEHNDKIKEQQLRDEVLGAITWVLGIVQDRRFSNFCPVLDVYIEKRFSVTEDAHREKRARKSGKVADAMLKAMQRLCMNPSDTKKGKRLRSSMKVWGYLFRIIVRARLLQQSQESKEERTLRDLMFKDELEQLLDLINQIMRPDQPSVMIGTQTLALQHFADTLGELRGIFSSKELVEITVSFVDACAHVTGKLVGFRLCMILAIVKGSVFNDYTCRLGLAKSVFRWVRTWLNSYMAVAKGVIFSRQSDSDHVDHQQARLTRVQWLENLRLSLTIISGVLEKMRRLSGMGSSDLSLSSISSSAISNLSRPASVVTTNGDEDAAEDSQMELLTITEMAMYIVPQLMDAYKDIQRLTTQAVHATGIASEQTVAAAGASSLGRSSSKHSLNPMRDRSNSIHLKQSVSITSTDEGGAGFTVLQALATSPTTPFPSTYPLQATSLKNNPAIAAVGHLAAAVTTGLMDITVVILELFYLTPQQQWINYLCHIHEHEGAAALALFLQKVCRVCMAILFGDGLEKDKRGALEGEENKTGESRKLPDQWLNLSVIAHHIVLNHILAPAVAMFEMVNLSPPSSPDPSTDEQRSAVQELWRVFFVSLLRVMSSPRLEIELFLPQTQRAVWKLAGNMKGAAGTKALLSLWRLTITKQQTILDDSDSEKRATDEDDDYISASESPETRTPVTERDDTGLLGTKEVLKSLNSEHENDSETTTMVAIISQKSGFSSFQFDLVPLVLRPLCAVTLTLHDVVREAGVSVMADMLVNELQRCGDLSRLQHILISAIDSLVMSENKGDDTIRNKLMTSLDKALESRLQEQGMTTLLGTAKKTVQSIDEFFSLLLQIRSLPKESDEFMDDRTSATLQLMQFIRLMGRNDMYIKYVHQLVAIHAGNNNNVEAALTLKFHADLLQWDPDEELPAVPDLDFPSQSAFARKEALYWKMIAFLEKGNTWELCIRLCKELAHEYEQTTYDYNKLSQVLQKEAVFLQNIISQERYFAEYFRVAFYGLGFPTSVRNKQFIYRGLEWEKMASFIERIQNQYPNAQIISGKTATASTPSEEQLREFSNELDGQYLQVTAVVPENEPGSNPLLENPLVPDSVKKYYMANEVDRFSFSRPFDKTKQNAASDNNSKPEMDFLNLWTRKTILQCEDKFPIAARRSLVISVEDVEISPIENAVLAIENKNRELRELNKKYAVHLIQPRRPSAPVNISPFSMALNGAVDAPVNGGVVLYRRAFLTDSYWEKNPEMRPWVRRLKTAIYDQVDTIDKCLETHQKLVSADMRPFHQNLVGFFNKNFQGEIERLHKQRDSRRSVGSDLTVDSPERLSLSRQNSSGASSPVLPLSPTLPMSPVFSSRRPSLDRRPSNLESSAVASRAESISRSLKMTLRKKKRGS